MPKKLSKVGKIRRIRTKKWFCHNPTKKYWTLTPFLIFRCSENRFCLRNGHAKVISVHTESGRSGHQPSAAVTVRAIPTRDRSDHSAHQGIVGVRPHMKAVLVEVVIFIVAGVAVAFLENLRLSKKISHFVKNFPGMGRRAPSRSANDHSGLDLFHVFCSAKQKLKNCKHENLYFHKISHTFLVNNSNEILIFFK